MHLLLHCTAVPPPPLRYNLNANLCVVWMLLAQVSSLTSQCDAHRSSSTTTPQTMLDRTPKAHSFEHDQTLYQQKAVLPKTKGTPTMQPTAPFYTA